MIFIRDFFKYLGAIFAESHKLILTAFDILGILLFFFPQVAADLVKNEALTRTIGGVIFFTSFLLANFMLYRTLAQNISPLDENSLLLYPHKNPPNNAVKMLYVGTEIVKDLEVKATYKDISGVEQTKIIDDFFPKADPKMWASHTKLDFLEPNQVAYFHLVQKKNTLDGKVIVEASFIGAGSGTQVRVREDFDLVEY